MEIALLETFKNREMKMMTKSEIINKFPKSLFSTLSSSEFYAIIKFPDQISALLDAAKKFKWNKSNLLLNFNDSIKNINTLFVYDDSPSNNNLGYFSKNVKNDSPVMFGYECPECATAKNTPITNFKSQADLDAFVDTFELSNEDGTCKYCDGK